MDYLKRPFFNKIRDLDKFTRDIYEKRRSDLADIGKLKNKVKHENLFERLLFQKGVNIDKDISLSKKYNMIKEKLIPVETMKDFNDVKHLLEESKTKDFIFDKYTKTNKDFSSFKTNNLIENLNLTKKFKFFRKKKKIKKDSFTQFALKSPESPLTKPRKQTTRFNSPVKIAKKMYKNMSYQNFLLKNKPLKQIIVLPKIENLTTDVSDKVEDKELNKSKLAPKLSVNFDENNEMIIDRHKKIMKRKSILSDIFQAFEKSEDGQMYAEYLSLVRRRDSNLLTYNESNVENPPSTLSMEYTTKGTNNLTSMRLEKDEFQRIDLKNSRNKTKNQYKSENKESKEKINSNEKFVSGTVNNQGFLNLNSKQCFIKSNCKSFLENSRKNKIDKVRNKLSDKYNQLNNVSRKINDTIKKALDLITKEEVQSGNKNSLNKNLKRD